MALKRSTTALQSTLPRSPRSLAQLGVSVRLLLPPLLLASLVLLLTLLYYGTRYQATVYADDRIRGFFTGFQAIEYLDGQPYRWTTGNGQLCLPAPGLSHPPAHLTLHLLGSSVITGVTSQPIDQVTLRVGAHALPFTLAPTERAYHLLVPPSAEAGPVCLSIESATVDPLDNGRTIGIGVRSLTLTNLVPWSLPPPTQLLVNLWLVLGSFWLLRSITLPTRLALPLVALITLAVGGALLTAALRFAPDLPYWSSFAALSLALLVASRTLYTSIAPRLEATGRELLGTTLIALLLTLGWVVLAHRPDYFWPFPLMARTGTAFGWGVLPAGALAAIFIALTIHWLRRPTPPAAPLVIASAWLAAVTLPATLKVGLRGWPTLYQTFEQTGNYIEDVPRVGTAPGQFLRHYVAIMPELAIHNKTHPPGGTLFLWGVEQLFGPGPLPAALVVILLAGLVVWPTYRLATALGGPQVGLLACAISVLLPAYMIYGATSMDALFAVPMAWAIWWLYAALVLYDQPNTLAQQLGAACAAGAWIAFSLFFSFTTFMLAFVVLALVARRIALGPRRSSDVLRWAAVGGALAGTVLLLLGALWLVTGYDSIAAFFNGVANNRLDVGARISPLGLSSYLFFLAVNVVAFGWYLGPWLIYRLGVSSGQQINAVRNNDANPTNSSAIGMSALLLGMLFAGLFYREIERIWLFSHILIAGTLALGIMEAPERRNRSILATAVLVTICIHSVIFRAVLRISW
jgi:hypothetical protein